jgi:hypothetical protein
MVSTQINASPLPPLQLHSLRRVVGDINRGFSMSSQIQHELNLCEVEVVFWVLNLVGSQSIFFFLCCWPCLENRANTGFRCCICPTLWITWMAISNKFIIGWGPWAFLNWKVHHWLNFDDFNVILSKLKD